MRIYFAFFESLHKIEPQNNVSNFNAHKCGLIVISLFKWKVPWFVFKEKYMVNSLSVKKKKLFNLNNFLSIIKLTFFQGGCNLKGFLNDYECILKSWSPLSKRAHIILPLQNRSCDLQKLKFCLETDHQHIPEQSCYL